MLTTQTEAEIYTKHKDVIRRVLGQAKGVPPVLYAFPDGSLTYPPRTERDAAALSTGLADWLWREKREAVLCELVGGLVYWSLTRLVHNGQSWVYSTDGKWDNPMNVCAKRFGTQAAAIVGAFDDLAKQMDAAKPATVPVPPTPDLLDDAHAGQRAKAIEWLLCAASSTGIVYQSTARFLADLIEQQAAKLAATTAELSTERANAEASDEALEAMTNDRDQLRRDVGQEQDARRKAEKDLAWMISAREECRRAYCEQAYLAAELDRKLDREQTAHGILSATIDGLRNELTEAERKLAEANTHIASLLQWHATQAHNVAVLMGKQAQPAFTPFDSGVVAAEGQGND